MKTVRRSLLCLVLLALLDSAAAIAATITVNTTADPGGFNNTITVPQLGSTITLRDAVNAVRNTGGTHTITFAPSLAGQTIYLTHGALAPHQGGFPAKNLTIQGLTGNSGVTIARDWNNPVSALLACTGSDLTLTVNDLTFTGGRNMGGNWGGAFTVLGGATVTINRCALTGNEASSGGAIFTRESTLNVNNSTIAGNSAGDGGGIFHLDGSVTLTHTTITNNRASAGGGMWSQNGGPLLVNTIVAGNHGDLYGHDLTGNGGSTTLSPSSHHSLIGDAASAGGLSNGVNNNIVGANALLNALSNNGGPTATTPLSPNSPARNAAAPGVLSTDQRGVSRPQGAGADMGAYELVDGAPTTFTSPGSVTFVIGFNYAFNVSANGAPSPAFSVSGALPSGVTFSAAGVLSGTPAAGTEGSYPLTITASNAAGQTTQSFTLVVISPMVVTTASDEDNGSTNPALGTGTSLREAIGYANGQSSQQAITFAANLAGQSIDLTLTGDNLVGATALRINGNITIHGLTGNSGITIRRATGSSLRPFWVYYGATLTLNDLTIADGLAAQGGAIFNSGTLRMNRCTVRNNTATSWGGGLSSGGGGFGQNTTLTNCTFAGNATQSAGGALFNDSSSTLNLTNVTVAGNTTTNASAGLEVAGGTVVAINTIIAGNKNGSGVASDVRGTLSASSQHNLIGTGGSGGLTNGVNGNIVGVQNPQLGPLAANGGPTQTIALHNSSARDAGANVLGVTADQRGVSRPQFGTPDIGAYEYDGTLESLMVTTAVDELDASSNPTVGSGTSLREALRYANSLAGAQTITFAPELAGQTITVSNGWNDANDTVALRVSGQIVLQGLTSSPGVTIAIAQGVQKRHLRVESGANLTVSHLTFTNGYGDYGGAIWSFGSLTVRKCTFTGNTATGEGGAIQSWGGSPLLAVENSTFVGNTSNSLASAIGTGATQTSLRHITITGNTAPNGALWIYETAVTMVNSIVTGNSTDGVVTSGGNGSGTFSAQSTNNILGASSATGLANGSNGNQLGVPASQLYFGSLGNNGGPTATVALQAGSVAIDAGVAISGLTTDQRGTNRPQGPAPDAGAFEFVYVAPAITSPNSTTFLVGRSNSFTVTATGNPPPTFSASGTLPAGVTFTAAGVLSGTPASGTEGSYPLTITASNAAGQTATQSFTLSVFEADLTVTTTVDEDNGSTNPALGTGTSLREAINLANTRSVPQTIGFLPTLAGQSIDLTITADSGTGASALRINKNITIQGLTGSSGITIRRASSGDLRPFLVFFGGTLTLNDLTIADGRASSGGGIYNYAILRMNRCTLRNNAATTGGAIGSGGGFVGQQATLTNCTVVNNQAPFGGGIANESSSVMNLTNVTVSGNTSSFGNGFGGINVGGTVVVTNTIVAGNTNAAGASDIGGNSVSGSSHHNLIGAGGSGGMVNGVNSNIVGVPANQLQLGSLGNNGGPTQTVALLDGSRALNAGATVDGLTHDQRGIARPQAGLPDIGAFERVPGAGTLVVTTAADEDQGTTDPAFGTGTSLREALRYAQSLAGAQMITFAPTLAGQTVTLTSAWDNANSYNSTSAIRIDGNITVQGPTSAPGITLKVADTAELRHFVISSGGTLVLQNLTLTGGKALLSGSAFGGSVWNFGTLTVRNSTFTGNTAGAEGGAIQSWGDSPLLLIENSTFSGNTSTGSAGAINCGAASMSFRHVTISNNTSSDGNALVIWGHPLTMVNSVIAGSGNEGVASSNGGGTISSASTNNILSAATAPGLTNGTNGNQLGVQASQLFLTPLTNNGGPTATIALRGGSIAIDAGVVIPGITTDQRGIARPFGSAPDIGAFELNLSTNASLTTISMSGGSLSPSFSSATTSYSAAVRNATASVTVTPAIADANATARVRVNSGPWSNVPSGQASPTLALNVGSNTIEVEVTAQAGNVIAYSIAVTRAAPGIEDWRVQYFGATGNAGAAANTANGDGDELNNAQEFAFGTDPTLAQSNVVSYDGNTITPGSPTTLVINTPSGVDFRALYSRRKDYVAAGLTYTVQFSADLMTWVSSAATPTVMADDGVMQAVTVPYPYFINGQKARFFQVVVTITP